MWIDASSLNGKGTDHISYGAHANHEYLVGDNITVVGTVYGTLGHFGFSPEHITPTSVGFHDYSYTGLYIFFGALELAMWSIFAIGIYAEARRRAMTASNAEEYKKRMRPLKKKMEKEDIKKLLLAWPSKEKCSICGYPLASLYLGNVECISCGKKACKFDSLRAQRGAKGKYHGYCTTCYRTLIMEEQASSPLVRGMKENTQTISWIQEDGRRGLLMATITIAILFASIVMTLLLVSGPNSYALWVFLFIGTVSIATFTAALVWAYVKVLFIEVSKEIMTIHEGKEVRDVSLPDIGSASFRPMFGLQGAVVLQTRSGEVSIPGRSGSLSFGMAVETLGALAARGIPLDEKTREWFKWTDRFALEREPFDPCPTCGDPVIKKFGAKLCRRCERMKRQSGA